MEEFAKKKDRELTWIAAIHKNPEHTSSFFKEREKEQAKEKEQGMEL